MSVPDHVTFWTNLCDTGQGRSTLHRWPSSLSQERRWRAYDVCDLTAQRACEGGCIVPPMALCTCEDSKCSPSRTTDSLRQVCLSLLAHLVSSADLLIEAWQASHDPKVLQLARLMKATAVGAVRQDPRMFDMEVIASQILAAHALFSAELPYVDPWHLLHPAEKIREVTDLHPYELDCEQPYKATYGIDGSNPGATSRKQLAEELRRSALEGLERWSERREGIDPSRSAWAAISVAVSLGLTYQRLRPSVDDPHLPPTRTIPILDRSVFGTTSEEERGQQSIEDLLEKTEEAQWRTPEVAERAVRLFLRALGLPKEQARSLFDPERKQVKRSVRLKPAPSGEAKPRRRRR